MTKAEILLIQCLYEYIEFLTQEYDNVSIYSIVHGWKCSEEVIKKGILLRKRINNLEKKIPDFRDIKKRN